MILSKLSNYVRGWLIGDFSPSVLRTKDFEVGVLTHSKGEVWPQHYHAKSVEYNVLLEGDMTIKGVRIKPGDIFILEPKEIADPVFNEDCTVLCIKIPSLPNDKILV